jgi:YVTN family beta-propeller protein
MKQFNFFRSLLAAVFLISSTLTFSSCSDDNDGPGGAYAEDGVFVINEGNFNQSNGSISYYNNSTQQVQHNIFSKENNNQLLGDVIQDMKIYGERAYIVANNSNQIEVVNAATFKSVGVVEGLQFPRYFVALNDDKGYVTETVAYGAPGRVAVIDLNSFAVSKTIEVGVQPEQLLLQGSKLYIANSGGNTITVINTATDAVESTITVPDAPAELALDRDNNLWVLSLGQIIYTPDWSAIDYSQTTAGALSKITQGSHEVQSFPFSSNQSQPGNLAINGSRDRLYFNYEGNTYVQDIGASSLSSTVFLNRSFYGLGVDPDNGYIYGGDDNAFAGDGTVHIYQPDGAKVGEFKAGIGPNGFVFQ